MLETTFLNRAPPCAFAAPPSLSNLTGHRWETATGHWSTLHRQLDPRAGRWSQRDPLGEFAGLNRYAYVSNRPFAGVDPTGEIAFLFAGGPASRPADVAALERDWVPIFRQFSKVGTPIAVGSNPNITGLVFQAFAARRANPDEPVILWAYSEGIERAESFVAVWEAYVALARSGLSAGNPAKGLCGTINGFFGMDLITRTLGGEVLGDAYAGNIASHVERATNVYETVATWGGKPHHGGPIPGNNAVNWDLSELFVGSPGKTAHAKIYFSDWSKGILRNFLNNNFR